MSVFAGLFKPRGERDRQARETAIADPIIDRIVAATDHRLATVKGYREALRAPVLEAREGLGEAIARIPSPIEVGARAWSSDGTLRALFARPDEVIEAFVADEGVQAYFQAHPASDCLCMLGLLQTERRVLASAMHGDSVQAEVARTTVSFAQPRVLAPAVDEAAVRSELVLRAFEVLGLRALERVGHMRIQKRELEQERVLLQAQLRLAGRRGVGFGAIDAAQDAPVVDRTALERDLASTVARLELAASRNLLPALVEELVEVLAHVEAYLAIEPAAIALDSMNFAVPETAPGAIRPRVATLRLAGRGPFAVLLARFPRAELRPPENRLADAAKYL